MDENNQNIAQTFLDNDSNSLLEKDNDSTSTKKAKEIEELNIEELYDKAQREFEDELLEKYDYKKMLQKKFRYISEDPNIPKISSVDEEVRKHYEIPKFRNFTRGEEKLTQQEILQKDFKDFLILKEFSGRRKDYPHSSRIPSEYVKKTEKTVKIEDPPVVFDFDGVSNKPTVIFYKNDADQLELIEVICGCGEKVFIELEYDEGKMVSYSPAIAKSEDIDKDTDIEVSELTDKKSDEKNPDNSENGNPETNDSEKQKEK